MEALAVKPSQKAESCPAKMQCFVEHCIEHRAEVARRRIDDLEDLGGRGLPLQRLGKFSFTLGKLTFEIGDPLLGIGERAVGRRAHFADLVGTDLSGGSYRIDTGRHRLSIGTSAEVANDRFSIAANVKPCPDHLIPPLSCPSAHLSHGAL